MDILSEAGHILSPGSKDYMIVKILILDAMRLTVHTKWAISCISKTEIGLDIEYYMLKSIRGVAQVLERSLSMRDVLDSILGVPLLL